MRFSKRLGLLAAAALTAVSLGGGLAVTAHAAPTTEMCAFSGGLCLNDQGGSPTGNVIGYGRGAQNNNFHQVTLSGMCGGGLVTQTCPFTVGSGLNSEFAGSIISKIVSLNNGQCVGTRTTDGHAIMGGCPDVNGNGGITGAIMIAYHVNSSCTDGGSSVTKAFYESRYWSNFYGTASSMEGPGSQGGAVFFGANGTETCYQQVSP